MLLESKKGFHKLVLGPVLQVKLPQSISMQFLLAVQAKGLISETGP